MATEVASLSLEVRSDQVREANLELRAMQPAASAAERAAEKWGIATKSAGQSSEEFSRKVRRNIETLEFQRAQLTRSAAEQERFAALRRAGVTAESAAGQAVSASVMALQAQRSALQATGRDMLATSQITAGAAAGFGAMARSLAPLLAAFTAAAAVQKIWQAGMKTADLGEQAAQVNLLTEELQAFRLAAAQNGISAEQLDTSMMRLHATMGAAARGGEEQIRIFERLGVNMLDADGKMRRPAELLPEIARSLLGLGNETERTALMIELFGKSGARMTTMLETWAQGTDNAVDAARRMGAITGPEVIKNWDDLSDKLKVAGTVFGALWSSIGSPAAGAAAGMLETIAKNLEKTTTAYNNLPKDATFWQRLETIFGGSGYKPMGVDPADLADARLNAELQKLEKITASANDNSEIDKRRLELQERKVALLQAEADLAARIATINRQASFEDDESWARRIKLPVVGNAPGSNPVSKGQGDAWARMQRDAEQYVAKKNAETAALGLNAQAAGLLAHKQELLAKAQDANLKITPQLTAWIDKQAAAMAAADAKFKNAKFMDDVKQRAEDFIRDQQIQAETVFMSTEAAAAYRYEQEMLNSATRENIELTAEQRAQISGLAQEMARTEARTTTIREMYDLAKQTVTGFFNDFYSGIQRGESVWQAFGNAAMNALNRIASKLIEMAAEKLFEQAFGGSKGGGGGSGGGWLGGLFDWITGGGGGSAGGNVAGSGMGGAFPSPYARGGAFESGVQRFARGAAFTNSIVNRPTLFPMARGAGLMGEAGPEAVVPLRRGRGGRLGIDASGMGGGMALNVVINNNAQAEVSTRQGQDQNGQPTLEVMIQPIEAAIARNVRNNTGSLNAALAGRGLAQRPRN